MPTPPQPDRELAEKALQLFLSADYWESETEPKDLLTNLITSHLSAERSARDDELGVLDAKLIIANAEIQQLKADCAVKDIAMKELHNELNNPDTCAATFVLNNIIDKALSTNPGSKLSSNAPEDANGADNPTRQRS